MFLHGPCATHTLLFHSDLSHLRRTTSVRFLLCLYPTLLTSLTASVNYGYCGTSPIHLNLIFIQCLIIFAGCGQCDRSIVRTCISRDIVLLISCICSIYISRIWRRKCRLMSQHGIHSHVRHAVYRNRREGSFIIIPFMILVVRTFPTHVWILADRKQAALCLTDLGK